jgi:hypothetical protein
MKLYVVWCEWDIGLNVDDHYGVYSSDEIRRDVLNTVSSGVWEDVEYTSWEDAKADGFLSLFTIEG